MIRALIFDFDGLILDTEKPIYLAWQEVFLQYGCQLPFERWTTIIGTSHGSFDPHAELEAQLGRALDQQQIEPPRRARELELIDSQAVLPGVQEILADARRLGLKLGVATSSSCRWVTGHLERLGLRAYFDCIRGKDDVALTKPDPALYRAVLEGLSVRAEEGIAFEDSPNGVLAARRAGIFCVAVPNEMTRGLSFDGASCQLDSLADLPLEALIEAAESRQNGTT